MAASTPMIVMTIMISSNVKADFLRDCEFISTFRRAPLFVGASDGLNTAVWQSCDSAMGFGFDAPRYENEEGDQAEADGVLGDAGGKNKHISCVFDERRKAG